MELLVISQSQELWRGAQNPTSQCVWIMGELTSPHEKDGFFINV